MKVEHIEIHNENSLNSDATGYFLDFNERLPHSASRPVVLIAPGGGYGKVAFKEGEPIALKFNSIGYHAIVLNYSVFPAAYPTALREVDNLYRWVVDNGKSNNIDLERIYLCGFSAGGHLMANYAIEYERLFLNKNRIKGMILGYPVITAGQYRHEGSFDNLIQSNFDLLKDNVSIEENITAAFPKTFVFATYDDKTVSVKNTVLLVDRLIDAGVEVESHIFKKGVHGLALADEVTMTDDDYLNRSVAVWFSLLENWLGSLT